MQTNGIRLHVFLARAGVASRRAGERLIGEGRVSVNGAVVTEPGTKVLESDRVCVDGTPAALEETKRYVLLYKPAGYVCTLSDEKDRPTAASLLTSRFSERLYNVGRLDMYSSGLIIFTNDGEFARRVSHPSSCIEKEYIAETTTPLPRPLCAAYQKGIRIDNVFYKAHLAQEITPRKARFILTEGKNREIRRVFAHFDCPIKRLTRIRIAAVRIDGLQEGCFRELSPKEVAAFLHE